MDDGCCIPASFNLHSKNCLQYIFTTSPGALNLRCNTVFHPILTGKPADRTHDRTTPFSPRVARNSAHAQTVCTRPSFSPSRFKRKTGTRSRIFYLSRDSSCDIFKLTIGRFLVFLLNQSFILDGQLVPSLQTPTGSSLASYRRLFWVEKIAWYIVFAHARILSNHSFSFSSIDFSVVSEALAQVGKGEIFSHIY